MGGVSEDEFEAINPFCIPFPSIAFILTIGSTHSKSERVMRIVVFFLIRFCNSIRIVKHFNDTGFIYQINLFLWSSWENPMFPLHKCDFIGFI